MRAHLAVLSNRMIQAALMAAAGAYGSAMAAEAELKDPVFTPPEGYVEAAPPGNVECPGRSKPQMTRAEFRQFALRNEVWPQKEGVDLSAGSWSAARVLQMPVVNFAFAGKAARGFRAEVYVLVDGEGNVLDKRVTCTTSPAHNEQLLTRVDGFRFEPSRYKGRGLHSVMPLHFEN